ncbi:DUF1269 domain-containing protein [Neomoorella thermoacetica]|uniref:DUF1269 domain-containing protein n=1 Tax=Neomoorella thermoacetica TaxID=1525 RepID=UPI0008FBA465|nr:general stress protein [Moorella thermoacetica]APC07927.1 heat induced stress protein YflT [Moorella thermoacetica]
MAKTVIAVFSNEQVAKEAVEDLRRAGFDREISILAKDQGREGGDQEGGLKMGADTGGISDGVTTGGVLGGLAGLAAGAGALVIPGIGPLIAAGPIAGLLSGAATGGVAGGLIDWGIPESEGREYENEIRQGKMLVSVRCDDQRADQANKILKDHGADRVRIH